MCPRKQWSPEQPRVRAAIVRIAIELGQEIRDERRRRGWTMSELGRRAGVSAAMVQAVEAGSASSLDGYVRFALALGLAPRFTLSPDRAAQQIRAADPVHSFMGEVQAEQIGGTPRIVRPDEPYQHYQFAGRADLVGYDPINRSLLHIENRTRFPDVQGFAGAFNQKRVYLAPQMAERFGIRGVAGGFRSIAHVVVALWSAEVLHALRLRTATFTAIAPDAPLAFEAWWDRRAPEPGTTTSLVIFDPLPGERHSRRRWVGLSEVRRVEPRYRDYAEALSALRAAGRA